MTINEIANAVVNWVESVLAGTPYELSGTYAFAPMGKNRGLPDAATEVENVSIVPEDRERFPHFAIEQAFLRIFETRTSLMVNQGRTDEQAEEAAVWLRDAADILTAALASDTTLGGAVPYSSPFVEFDFVPQFVVYEDGTRGRQVAMLLAVAEPIGD